MKLTNPEKLILTMLSEIHEKLEIENGIDTKLLTSAIYSDNTWALDWEMPGIVCGEGEPTPPAVKDVTNTLDMWTFIEEAYESFSAADKEKVKLGAEPFGAAVRFSGFDGNNEGEEFSIASFLINDMGRFSRFKGRELNSHCPSVDGYQQMYAVFEPIRSTLGTHGLSPTHVIDILLARRYRE